MFTLNVTKELNDWAVPKLNVNNDVANEYITPDHDSETEVYLEIQCVKQLDYSCDICDKKFATREDRNNHIDDHFKLYACKTCGESLIGDRQFEHHRLSNKCVAKTKIESITYECFLCHKGNFFSTRSLKIHFNRLHKPKQKNSGVNVCQYCSKTFANIYILKSHVNQIHLEGQRCVCKDCGKAFNRPTNLQWHQLIHQNKLPCTCKICGKTFRTLSGLNLHKRTHTGEKPYVLLKKIPFAISNDVKIIIFI